MRLDISRFVHRAQAVAVLCLGVFAGLSGTDLLANPAAGQPEYELRPGDVVAVSVWQEPGLEQLVLVRPDGGISFPLAGDLRAEGLTIEDLAAAITGRLSRYIPEPVVTVTLQEIPGNRIYVIGRVNNPGDYPIVARDVSVVQALAMAGGLTPFADEKNIRVLRMEDGEQRAIPFDYKKVRRGEELGQNIALQAGDVIIVP